MLIILTNVQTGSIRPASKKYTFKIKTLVDLICLDYYTYIQENKTQYNLHFIILI